MIEQLKNRWKGYKEKRFLASYGCETWREYERRYDKDIGPMARWAHTYYHGYPHIFPLNPEGLRGCMRKTRPRGFHPYHDQCEQMMAWCEQNCTGKWRNDWHRGWWDLQGNYELNEIGGGDIMFFAFKEESDYVWFTLVWS